MLHALRIRLRLWWLGQLRKEAFDMMKACRGTHERSRFRAALDDYDAQIARLKQANPSVQRLHG